VLVGWEYLPSASTHHIHAPSIAQRKSCALYSDCVCPPIPIVSMSGMWNWLHRWYYGGEEVHCALVPVSKGASTAHIMDVSKGASTAHIMDVSKCASTAHIMDVSKCASTAHIMDVSKCASTAHIMDVSKCTSTAHIMDVSKCTSTAHIMDVP
jgi:hypothetical protein